MMSRAYRIKVRESLQRVVRASDHVSTQLEVLEILPADQMAQLLAEELERRGFQRRGKSLIRRQLGITIEIDPETATVTVEAETKDRITLEAEKNTVLDRDLGGARADQVKEAVREELRRGLEEKSARQAAEIQQQLTEKLEGSLADLRQELNQVVNRVTAEALKRKAAQIGQIKEMTEDRQSGTLTIVLEV
jgi:FtsH ternary system domain X5